jgi:hypothetical protein
MVTIMRIPLKQGATEKDAYPFRTFLSREEAEYHLRVLNEFSDSSHHKQADPRHHFIAE